MIVFEYDGGGGGRRELTDWRLDDRQRRALNRKLDLLEATDSDQAVGSIMFKVKGAGLYKIKVKGNVQLRPRLCFGPRHDDDREVVTFLQRVVKKDKKEDPSPDESAAMASRKMAEVVANQSRRVKLRG